MHSPAAAGSRRSSSRVGCAVALFVGVARPARAAGSGRVAVVVEVGGVVHTAKVSFSGGSITGLQALSSAGFAPVVRAFSGQGGAVCALVVVGTTIGCPADSSCLNCASPDYWGYWRAGPGAKSYTYSRAAASSTSAVDGSVEAWSWSAGSAPKFVSFDSVWGSPPPPPTTTTKPPATVPKTTPTTATHSTVPSTRATTASGLSASTTPGSVAAPGSTGAGSTTSATSSTSGTPGASSPANPASSTGSSDPEPGGTSRPRAGGKAAAASLGAHGGGGGSAAGLIVFALVVAILLAAIVAARARRTLPGH